MIDFSIIVPVYNVEPWIAGCLDSLVHQTYRNIEIVCVDDGSTDGSVEVIQRYMAQDARIKLIQQPNSGTVIARKRAVEQAAGRYFLFVDPDDYLSTDACERILGEMALQGCDILQFGVEIHETGERTEAQRKKSQAYFNPSPCSYDNVEIFRACYLQENICYNLIFRCFDGNLVRKAFGHIPDVYSINETDVFAFFFIAYHAKNFVSISDRYYHYRYGIGVSTKRGYNLEEFKKVLCKFDTLKVLKDFAETVARNSPDVVEAYQGVVKRMTANACTAAFGRMASKSDCSEAFKMVREKADGASVIRWLIMRYAKAQADCAEMLVRWGLVFPCKKRAIKHIGLFYYHLSCGGIQRVVQLEMQTFLKMGYKVTLFLEEALTESCYSVPPEVEVVYLPRTTGKDAVTPEIRFDRLVEALARTHLDVFYSHAHVSATQLWDLLACKWVYNIPFILHFHNLFALPLYLRGDPSFFLNTIKILRCADQVIALSRADSLFFRANDVRACYLQNPIDSRIRDMCREAIFPEKDPNLVLWVGRISPEKRPEDAIRIFNELHRINSEARLLMVGGGSENLMLKVTNLVEEYKLNDVVTLTGEQLDTYPYYRRASIFLSTSKIEGFPLTSVETLSAGDPIVAYAIPHLETYRDNPAVFQVPQGDVVAAARALDALLRRKDLHDLRKKAKAFIANFCSTDFESALRGIVEGGEDSLGVDQQVGQEMVSMQDVSLCMGMLATGLESMRQRGAQMLLNARKAQIQHVDLHEEVMLFQPGWQRTKRQGLLKVMSGCQCVLDNGFKYTAKHFVGKVARKLGVKGVTW